MIGRVTAGGGADGSAAAGISADTGLSGRATIDTARNARAKPAGTAIQPAHRAAGIMRRKNCRSRDLGRGSAGGGGASPCHSHKPASLMSVLISAVDGDVGASPVTIGATLYAWPINSRGSACMDHNPLFVVAPISNILRAVGATPPDGLGAASVSKLPYRRDPFLAGRFGVRNNHGFEVRRRPRVLFVAERQIRLASAATARLARWGKEMLPLQFGC